ncbi:ribosome maturation factor RimP [Kiloniella sp. b19]|uniref:ribosome maturation factor RimP n=1 Tax=Kiloniella sp. GXU_MW_B19 TaxID=3141326 RepID=UPI0031CF6D7C
METNIDNIPDLSSTSEGQAAEVERLIAPTLAAMGYQIVRVSISGQEDRKVLQIMAERLTDGGMSVEDCADISRAAEAILDVEDPISGQYALEVSSAGVDRPLTRLRDFHRFAGFHARVEMSVAVEGRRRFKGRILGVEGEAICLELDEETEARLAFGDVVKAKLLLTDELMEAMRPSDQEPLS